MKIYPSPHAVRVAEVPEYLDIPVAHIEQEYHPEEIVTTINPAFALENKQFIAPYQSFSTDNMLFFDNEENIVKPTFRRKGANYVYEPKNTQEFVPEEFNLTVLIKRDDWLDPSRKYDINVGVYKQTGSKKFATNLISIFGDASYRKIAPANVSVNEESTSVSGLQVSSSSGLDWLFIETHDASHLKSNNKVIDFDELMSDCCNIWLTVEDDGVSGIFDKLEPGKTYSASMLSYTGSKVVDGGGELEVSDIYGYAAKRDHAIKGFPDYRYNYLVPMGSATEGINYTELYPVYILEKPNSGFIVISHENMFSHLDEYSTYVYNIMLQLYFKSYVKTPQKTLWITDNAVDYMGSLKSPFRRNHPQVNLGELIQKADKNIVSYVMQDIIFDVNDVTYVGKDDNGNMSFKKITATDPVADEESVSVYTTRKTVAIYKDSAIRTIESSIRITTEIDDDERCFIVVSPFKSSKYRLVSSTEKKFELKNITEKYVLYALPIDHTNESTVGVIMDENYNKGGVKLARIKVKFVGDAVAYDVRLLGGGLPEKYTDYEMFDISNVRGRPYRVGTGAIVNMPWEYEEYDELIQDAINKHKVAADRIYIRYGDLEEDLP